MSTRQGEANHAVREYNALVVKAKAVTSPRWQYQTESRIVGAKYSEEEEDFLSRMGAHGWEFCGVIASVLRGQHVHLYYFKRAL